MIDIIEVIVLIVSVLFLLAYLLGLGQFFFAEEKSYSPNDPRLNHKCPECGCGDILECGHHD